MSTVKAVRLARPSSCLWLIKEGRSQAKVRAATYDDAKQRAALYGFKQPDSIEPIEGATNG